MFKKGVSGNPKGKPKGAKSKVKGRVAECIKELFENNIESFQENFDQLEPKERLMIMFKLLEYIMPKAKEKLEAEQQCSIIDRLKALAEGKEVLSDFED